MIKEKTVSVSIGDGLVTIMRRGQTSTIVAEILGVKKNDQGEIVQVWLDRLVHRPQDTEKFIGWHVSGTVSSILTREEQEPKDV